MKYFLILILISYALLQQQGPTMDKQTNPKAQKKEESIY